MRHWAAAVSGVAVSPVPIAQTGSYAITILANCSSDSAAMAHRNCSISAFPAFFFSRSPTQTIGVSPASMAATVFSNTLSLVSPKYLRRSLCPTITCEQPNALIIGPETSPVKAPSVAQQRFCAPTCILVPRVALTAVSKLTKEGQITISQFSERSTSVRKLSKKDVVPAPSLCIFQFPQITGIRISVAFANPHAQQSDRKIEMQIALHFGALRSMLVDKTFQTLTTGQGESRIRE